MMTNALATPKQRTQGVMAEVSRALDANRKTIVALLPQEITPERLKALALTSLRKTPQLLKCDPKSILGAVFECAKLGLQPDSAMSDCHLVPFKGKATLILGYRGLMKLARRACPGMAIKAEHVCEHDEFEWSEGLTPTLEHKRAPAGKRGRITHAYAIARLPGGFVELKVIDSDDVARAKKTSRSDAWAHHEGSMWEKTALRRLCKVLPMDDPATADTVHRAIEIDEAAVDDREQNLGIDIEQVDSDSIDVEAGYMCPACDTQDDQSHAPGCPEVLQ